MRPACPGTGRDTRHGADATIPHRATCPVCGRLVSAPLSVLEEMVPSPPRIVVNPTMTVVAGVSKDDRLLGDWHRWLNFWRLRRHTSDGVWVEYYRRINGHVVITGCGVADDS